MTARSIGRARGVVITCNRCGATTQTANIVKSINREHAARSGWGRGSCPAVRTLEEKRGKKGQVLRAGRSGSLGTKSHDLCSRCLPLDREAARKIALAKAEAKKAKAEKTKARYAALKPAVTS